MVFVVFRPGHVLAAAIVAGVRFQDAMHGRSITELALAALLRCVLAAHGLGALEKVNGLACYCGSVMRPAANRERLHVLAAYPHPSRLPVERRYQLASVWLRAERQTGFGEEGKLHHFRRSIRT